MYELLKKMDHEMPEYPGIMSPIALDHERHRVLAERPMVSRDIVSWFTRTYRRANRQARKSADSDDASAEPAAAQRSRVSVTASRNALAPGMSLSNSARYWK